MSIVYPKKLTMTTTTSKPYLNLEMTVNIESFCSKWIPRLYGYQPDEYGYKKYCVLELVKLMGGEASADNIKKHWKWKNGQTRYPKIVNQLLMHVDARYSTIEANCGIEWLKTIHKVEREQLKNKNSENPVDPD